MPLIKCPECGHEISDYSSYCIFCGCPMAVIKKIIGSKQTKVGKKKPVVADKPEKNKKDKTKNTEKSFFSGLDHNRSQLVRSFETQIKYKIRELFISDKPNFYLFRLSIEDKDRTLCWVTFNEEKELIVKYYLNMNERNETAAFILTKEQIQKIIDNIYKVYEKMSGKDNREVPKKTNDDFLSDIVLALKKRTPKGTKDEKELCKSVADFVLNEIKIKAKANKEFRNDNEFNKLKYNSRFRADFFGYTFTFKHLKNEDAKVFFDYYKAAALVGKIKEYEGHFQKQIIENYNELLTSLYEMIKYNDIDYSKSKGLLSTFANVPEEALNVCLAKLEKYEYK